MLYNSTGGDNAWPAPNFLKQRKIVTQPAPERCQMGVSFTPTKQREFVNLVSRKLYNNLSPSCA